MNEKQFSALVKYKRGASLGLIIGFVFIIASFFISSQSKEYVLAIGMGIAISSMLNFGFGLFILLMEEMTKRSKGIR